MIGNIILLVAYSIWTITLIISIIKTPASQFYTGKLTIYDKISLYSVPPLILFTIIIFMIFDK